MAAFSRQDKYNKNGNNNQKRFLLPAAILIASIIFLILTVSRELLFLPAPPVLLPALPVATSTTTEDNAAKQEATTNGNSIFLDCASSNPPADDLGLNVKTSATSASPSFNMQIHDPEKDHFVSKDIKEKGCYECDVLFAAMNALQSNPQAVLIDVGTNIGLYTLSAAAAGHSTYSFEPAKVNYQRICQSIKVNDGFEDRVNVINRAVTKTSTVITIDRKAAQGNLGALKIGASVQQKEMTDVEKEEGVDYAVGVPLDSLIDSPLPTNRPVLLKVDVEGQECNALAGGLKYLEKLDIIYAAVEWSNARLRQDQCQGRTEIFDMFTKKGLLPYQHIGSGKWQKLDPSEPDTWKSTGRQPNIGLFDVAWSRSVMPN
jgi:FkbM family methyltransferase